MGKVLKLELLRKGYLHNVYGFVEGDTLVKQYPAADEESAIKGSEIYFEDFKKLGYVKIVLSDGREIAL